jgi:hypothetical protein
MNLRRRTTANRGGLGPLVAGAIALMSITGCGSAVSVVSPTSAATLSPTTGAAPIESVATQSPAATSSTALTVVSIAVGNGEKATSPGRPRTIASSSLIAA